MRSYSKLSNYPLGSIRAEGFLKEQMLRSKDGMGGHLYELEPEMINDPFVKNTEVTAWAGGDQAGWGAEISGNYWTGYIELAFTLGDKEMIEKATWWVDTVINSQYEDGYIGTYYKKNADIHDDYNSWGTTCAMRGLIAFYEATGRKDVLDAVYRCMLWFCDNWAGDNKTSYVGAAIIEPMAFIYLYTGDERFISFINEYEEYLCRHDIFSNSYKSLLENDFRYCADHTAGAGFSVRLHALAYLVTGNKDYLKACERRISQIYDNATQLSGSPVSVTEYFGPKGEVNETEYCSYAYFNATYSCLSYITGKSKYGDHMEEMFYNGAQGARKKDEKAIAYLSAPNQIYATTTSSYSAGDMQVYAPCYPVACCPVNAVAVLPEFVRGMFLHDKKDGVYAAAYGPCTLCHDGISITEDTLYPFRNKVLFKINCNKSFRLYLRIPSWSKGYTVTVNGKNKDAVKNRNGYACVFSDWKCGDKVEISFEAEVKVIKVDDSDDASKFPIAFKYGALLFSYHIPELWKQTKARSMTQLPEGWSWYDVVPDFEEAKVKDPHEMIGLRRNVINWNIAVDEKISADDVRVKEVKNKGYVWEDPPIELHTYCYKAPYLCATYPTRTFIPFGKNQPVTDRKELTLVPYGCTNLRISYFPKAKPKKQ